MEMNPEARSEPGPSLGASPFPRPLLATLRNAIPSSRCPGMTFAVFASVVRTARSSS